MRQQSLSGTVLPYDRVPQGSKGSRDHVAGICPGGRLASRSPVPGTEWAASSPDGGRCPIRTHVRRPNGPPLLYFAAVLAVRSVRISLLTSGAKRARTADLLHAIWRQHVHPRPSPQVTILQRPYAATCVRTCCCTFLLYRCHPCQAHPLQLRCRPDQRQLLHIRLQAGAIQRTADLTGADWAGQAPGIPSASPPLPTGTQAHAGVAPNFLFCRE